MRRKAQQGVAMITAVMVVAFATTIAAGMLVRQNIVVHRSANLSQNAQAWWYLIGLEQWATQLLRRDREDNAVDSLDEPWAQAVDFLPVDEGALGGKIIDLQSRFNLNRLALNGEAGRAAQQQFIRLLRHIEELRSTPAEQLAGAIRDWIDEDQQPGLFGGAEDNAYMGRQPPYRAANRLLSSVSELLLIDGFDRETWQYIEPHVTVLPVIDSKINVNTASAPVLASLHEDLTIIDAENLIAVREDEPFDSIAKFLEQQTLAARAPPQDWISVDTEYFLAQGVANIGNISTSMSSMMRRSAQGQVRVLAHAKGAL